MPALTHFAPDAPIEDMMAVLARDAGLIIDAAIPEDLTDQARDEIFGLMGADSLGKDDFVGFKTRRVGSLMARSPACRALAMHKAVRALAGAFLKDHCDDYQLHLTQAVAIGPGEGGQMLHRDRGVWGGYIPRRIETQFSTNWALTDFTEENGATAVVPGSHLWEGKRQPRPDEIAHAEMKAGSVLIFTGTVIHGGGANRTDRDRLGALLHYAPNWLRQQENQYLSCPPDVAATLAPELRRLMGYTKASPVCGFYSAHDGAPGQELAPPEALFGEDETALGMIGDSESLLERTKR
ncbi:phytanoyl-CoA dioxygenase family protein [Pacificimonas sp. WHA3]|uniref:Phytanoyl-CoA dioxygenase family protein n=1 Tax=Pacificimonas pallii TaxID=2827236 RepID=A0ABS6SFS2_9SPHN|nr:phytanoyl-CoA dioxygenase family protein [Pacificimonas pallii]MBV7257196.1 phytanoyl-CoA dioxygenase family protein [Pacificimonas pallii]